MTRQREIIKAAIELLEYVDSMNHQINKAGGMSIPMEELNRMTALELLCRLAPNNIHFVYTEGEKE